MNTATQSNMIGLADAWQRAAPIEQSTVAELQHQVDMLSTALRMVIELSANAPEREAFANIAIIALTTVENA